MRQSLFVYGTLRSDHTHPVARHLHSAAEHVGEGWAQGVLYDLGSYPGAIFDEGESARIRGEVFAFSANGKLLDTLDRYEGLASEHPFGDYERLSVSVRLGSGHGTRHGTGFGTGRRIEAWAYALVFPRGPRVASGDWLEHAGPDSFSQP
ncbi:gamma-glutamylcyclotransferase family protein [Methyloligella sp. 2.7D]|uniref:gamma-glutamylcyclotransferase family protein n=1 Tax=unclassified Methyloligella TaxID=2625955 RepID=UPI00157D65B4|nr:gamma-glutamylcyclotransferase family protein [Methyloligella sp. GL2]QKP78286.1 gamma-glutamylcyclotransferase [Methyloligella sp. GL2]